MKAENEPEVLNGPEQAYLQEDRVTSFGTPLLSNGETERGKWEKRWERESNRLCVSDT